MTPGGVEIHGQNRFFGLSFWPAQNAPDKGLPRLKAQQDSPDLESSGHFGHRGIGGPYPRHHFILLGRVAGGHVIAHGHGQ